MGLAVVDFDEMRRAKAKAPPTSPREIFTRLPKPAGLNDLYASQAEVLDGWYKRRAEKDLVLKLPTGGGKTLVGLLIGQSALNEKKGPVAYFAPTTQLVQQALDKSVEYGIPAVPYVRQKPLATEFAIGVEKQSRRSYESLFNGRSRFGVRGAGNPIEKIGVAVLDDAHAALSSVRDAFTHVIGSPRNTKNFMQKLRTDLERTSMKSDAWRQPSMML